MSSTTPSATTSETPGSPPGRWRWRRRVVAWLEGLPQDRIWVLAFLLTGVFGLGDYAIRRQLELSVLYVVPVGLVTYYVGRRQGLLVSLLAAAVWTLVNEGAGEAGLSPVVLAFNGTVRLVMFLVVVGLVDALRHAFDAERKLARTDPLTGAANYRGFVERAEDELARARRYERPVGLIALDLDGFKDVNDALGHEAGDAVLVATAEAIRRAARRSDLVARMGGDEFMVLLPETGPEGARAAAEKILTALRRAMATGGWAVTASIGVLARHGPPGTVEHMMRQADALMYHSKAAGGDRITGEARPRWS
jgi:diguanylate cyclase (GGDEF)-like protein